MSLLFDTWSMIMIVNGCVFRSCIPCPYCLTYHLWPSFFMSVSSSPRWCKWLALWPVEHAVMLDCMGSDLDPSIKVSRPQCQSPSVIHTLPWSVSYLNDLWDSVRVTKPFRSCRPAWLEMDRKFCPTATTSLHFFTSRAQLCVLIVWRFIYHHRC